MGDDDKVTAYAAELGREAGKNAAEWYVQDAFGGRTTGDPRPSAERALEGINEGDPEVLDGLPSPDLSGQNADSLTGPRLVVDAIRAAGLRHVDGSEDPDPAGHAPGSCAVCDWWDATGTVCDAYEYAFADAAADEVARQARLVLGRGGER